MTVSAAEARTARQRLAAPQVGDKLIPFPVAAKKLGKTPETLRAWHDAGCCPAVVSPGGQWSTYESFIAAVLASARPKQAGQIEDIARDWFAAHTPEAVA